LWTVEWFFLHDWESNLRNIETGILAAKVGGGEGAEAWATVHGRTRYHRLAVSIVSAVRTACSTIGRGDKPVSIVLLARGL